MICVLAGRRVTYKKLKCKQEFFFLMGKQGCFPLFLRRKIHINFFPFIMPLGFVYFRD